MGDTIFQCEFCHNAFAIKARKGRPPKFCDECKKIAPTVAERKRLLAQERVDRLTKKLSARGLALTQHED